MTIAYFDCFSGAGGDMIVAALIDAGADMEKLRAGLQGLGVGGYSLTIEKVKKQGFAAKRFHVGLEDSTSQPHRHLKDVVRIIEGARLPPRVQEKSIRVFERLAQAEAAVHGTTVEKVHFHEVGAVDAILDVVGAVLALDLLGVERVICSPIPVGTGTVRCAHGVMPVPAPATAELLKGTPIVAGDESGELITPTAAAVLTTLADGYGAPPDMVLDAVGYGAGTRDGQTLPNVLRVLVGRPAGKFAAAGGGDADQITVLEANLDDCTPETIGYCMERLGSEGALDVFAVPIQMKKSRLGVLLTVLCAHDRVAALERVLFAETTTFGIRRHVVARCKLLRRHETVATAFGAIRMKVGEREGVTTVSPEYEDCKTAALTHRVALREVMAAANQAWEGRPRIS